jgi:MoaD family protein
LKVRVSIVGFLEGVLPSGKDIIEAESITVSGILDALVKRYGRVAAEKLRGGTDLREGLSLLVNGRNVRSLPDKFKTSLEDDDEVVITVQVSGG